MSTYTIDSNTFSPSNIGLNGIGWCLKSSFQSQKAQDFCLRIRSHESMSSVETGRIWQVTILLEGTCFFYGTMFMGEKGVVIVLEKPQKKSRFRPTWYNHNCNNTHQKNVWKMLHLSRPLPKIRKMSKQFEPTIFYNHQEPFLREAVWSQGSVLICVAQMESTQQIRQSLRDSTICNGVFFSWSFQSSGFSALRRWDACNIRQDIAMSFRLFVGLT